ncbi:hypothetical protein BDY19DRAFT_725708 [Irpex rosettiformis]|uniref:Uncharacterized protein n=1 Tax=Irpex rosettiformis TaxID=378272 RepID=A0ACB8U8U8_9APHY|nr:hypothetical protein BDY19DRAFT_725708 [Irpex rosettiformis]
MRSLPAKPPQCPDDENNTLSNAPIEPSNVARKPTILPTLAFSLANNSLQLTEIQDTTCLSETHASSGQSPGPLKSKRTPNPTSKEFGSDFVRARGHAKPRPPDGDLHANLPTTPKTPLPPTSASDTGTARVRRTRSHTNPPRPKASKASSDGPSLDPSTALTPSRTIREDSPGLPAPDIYKPRTDFELIQNLLVDEICRRKELEEIIKAERQFSTDLTATYENKICAFDRTLDMALHMQKGLETQLLDARANSTQIEATLNKCRDDLSKMQAELVLEREERLRMTALLGEARRERETPSVLPALAQAVSFVDRLTARVMEDVV